MGLRFKIVEQLQVDRLELTHEINFTVVVYGMVVLAVEAKWPDVSTGIRFLRFYALTMIACWWVKRAVGKLPRSPRIVSQHPPESSSS